MKLRINAPVSQFVPRGRGVREACTAWSVPLLKHGPRPAALRDALE